MPKALEDRLMREADAKGFKRGGKRWRAYVYGTMAKIKEHLSK